MGELSTQARHPSWLDETALATLRRRIPEALRRARSSATVTLASSSARTLAPVDPTATVIASRERGDDWFCMEQGDRDGSAVAGLGTAYALQSEGEGRFTDLAAQWRALAARSHADPPAGPPGCGLVAVGGFAFSPGGSSSRQWAGFAPASLLVPELSLARRGEETWFTLNSTVSPDDTLEDVLGRLHRRLASLRSAPLPLLDPAPAGRYDVRSPIPPSHYEEAVARAVQRIRAGELEKVVLAREVEIEAPLPHDAAAVIGVLRQGFPACFTFAVGRGEATFLGASPELLVRREGQRASTVALAGSTRRSADPAVDDHLGERLLRSHKDIHENAIVARRIARALSPHAVWVTAAPEPVLVRVANIQHLATPIRAQLRRSLGAIELAGLLHPTPAVGGEPAEVSARLIPALEGIDRGWYAGPIGWTDSSGDGEFCVALRCALLRGTLARCYAGCGIVADSDPAAELAETEIKLGAMLPVLTG